MKKWILVSLAACLMLVLLCGIAMAEQAVPDGAKKIEQGAVAKTPSFVTWLYGPTNVRVSGSGLKGTVTWSRDSSGNADGYVVYQCGRSAYKPSSLPYGWYTIVNGYYWYPVKMLGTTSGTSMGVQASSAGTYYIEVDSYYISPSYAISSRGGFATFTAKSNSVSAPKNVKATQSGSNKVKLTWTAGDGAKTYAIYRREGTSGSFKKIGSTKKLNYTDKKAKNGKKYQYKVQAVNGSKKKFSSVAKAYPMAKPSSVKAANAGAGKVNVSWKKVKGAKTYSIYEKAPGSSSFSKVASAKTTKATITVSQNGTYSFYVVPMYGSFAGLKSGNASVSVTSASPVTPPSSGSVTYRAILLANTYPNGDSPLPMCEDDKIAMENMLKNLGATSYTVYTAMNQTGAGMQSKIRSVFSMADDDDVTILYYTGHGLNASGSSYYSEYQGSLCGVDNGFDSYVTPSQLRSILDQYKGTKVILLNSCHSGAMIGKDGNAVNAKTIARRVNSSFIQAFYSGDSKSSTNLADSGYYVITACLSSQTGIGITSSNGDRYSIFTRALVDGLGWNMLGKYRYSSLYADTNGDNGVSIAECYSYTKKGVDQMESDFNSRYGWDIAMDVQVYPANCASVFFAR